MNTGCMIGFAEQTLQFLQKVLWNGDGHKTLFPQLRYNDASMLLQGKSQEAHTILFVVLATRLVSQIFLSSCCCMLSICVLL